VPPLGKPKLNKKNNVKPIGIIFSVNVFFVFCKKYNPRRKREDSKRRNVTVGVETAFKWISTKFNFHIKSYKQCFRVINNLGVLEINCCLCR
jgi:hypothetical protein